MKKLFLFAAAAALLAACSSKDDLSTGQQPQQPAAENNGSIGFDAYLERGTTRAGLAGEDINVDALQGTNVAPGPGFGVFAYYTDNRDYDQLALPNFMYNQQVKAKFAGGGGFESWTYSPVMYWPNEYGYNAISDDFDKVTFFAYAPFVPVTPATGKLNVEASVQSAYETAKSTYETAKATWKASDKGSAARTTWSDAKTAWANAQKAYYTAGGGDRGITSMSRNSATGDPIVKYIGSFDNAQAVDLLWGVCNQADWTKIQAGDAQKFTIGKPWLDVQRPAAVDQKLKFTFKHATAKMLIKIDEFNDSYVASTNLDAATRIWIRSVRFTGFTMQGALNLNNEEANKPYWLNYSGQGDLTADGDVFVYDGRKDSKEGVSGAEATNEKSVGLNPQFIETEECFNYTSSPTAWETTDHEGVTGTLTNLFHSTGSNGYFYVIPTDDDMEIEIVYDVETIDPQLSTTLADGKTPGSSIENRISKKITFGASNTKLEAGKAYEIKLHLGMNSVKFDADVMAWEDMADPDIDLPANMPSYKATTGGNLDLPGASTSTVIAVTGLQGGESVTAASTLPASSTLSVKVSSDGDFATEENRANASGVVYVQVSGIKPNASIVDLAAQTITVTGVTTGATTINVVQKAQPLAMAAPASKSAGTDKDTYVLTSGLGTWSSVVTGATPSIVKVWCDGAELTVTGSAPSDESEVQFTFASGTLKFKSDRKEGQIIKVTIKAGDVPEETISFKIDA